MQTFLLVDGHAIMHRAFHALPPFKTKEGIPTHVVYGFFSMIYKAITDFSPSYLTVCFDTPAPTFRNKIFKEYQIQRPKIASEFKSQIPSVKKGLDLGGVVRLEKDGFEADDLIGTIAKKSSTLDNKQIKVLILSGDRDILQLVDDNILAISPQIGFSTTKIYDANEVTKKFMVAPSQIADFKALAGDQSDNYLGAKGIGPKTADKLINKFQTVENLLKHLDKIENLNIRKILKENKDNIFLAKKLAEIVTDVKIDFDIKKAKFTIFKKELKDFLLKLEMKLLVKRIFEEVKHPEEKNSPKESKKPETNQMGLF
jgi:DNA polymerase-1